MNGYLKVCKIDKRILLYMLSNKLRYVILHVSHE